jgi:glycerol-3-phosphate dehydrogenase (NAD(P)+)
MSLDPLGVELGGIIKNVIAIAAGVSDGLDFGDSARAGLITRGLAEIMRMGTAMGANPLTFFGLSGLGDLIMTATCDTSRNRTVGIRLGRGESLEAIVKSLGSVAEGVTTAPILMKLAAHYNVDMPVTTQVSKLLKGETTPQDLLSAFIARPLKMEF